MSASESRAVESDKGKIIFFCKIKSQLETFKNKIQYPTSMARIRKFVSYRRIERPYTRTSKYENKSYVRMSPNIKIIGFEIQRIQG